MKTLIAYIALCAGMLLFACHAKAQEVYPGVPYSFALHQLCEEHYYHAKLSVFQAYQELGYVQDALDECIGKVPELPGCEPASFGGGNVWKPESENNGRVVVVLKSSYCDGQKSKITSFKVLDSQGNEAATAKLRHCGVANGGRAHYDLSKAASDLPNNLTLQVETASGCDLFSVPVATNRYD